MSSLSHSAHTLGVILALCSLFGSVFSASATSETLSSATATSASTAPSRVLRVAADPNNLPFSNDNLQGFENRIAEQLAAKMGVRLEYVWHAQRRGFIRNTLKANKADITLGVPAGFELCKPTDPIYRSSYVFVTRKDSGINIASLDDPQLRKLKVGVQLVGDDGSNTPPAHALGRRGIVENLKGYTVYGDYSQPNPSSRIMEGVAKGEVDVGIVWGPLAGYFASREAVPLSITPVTPAKDGAFPMAYSICIGVRRGDDALFAEVEQAIEAARPEIEQILKDYQVPQVAATDVPEVPEDDDDD